jgi:heat shock protein HslJ
MTIFTFANNINTTLAGAVSPSATTITLSSTANLPASIPAGQVLVITLNDSATRQNYEIVYATARTGATLTVLRGQEGTSALSWLTGDFAYSPPTAGQQSSFGQIGANNTWSGANTFSSPVTIAAGAIANEAVNLGQFLASLTQTGYAEFPFSVGGSLVTGMIQWGQASTNTSGIATLTLATPFPNALLVPLANYVNNGTTITTNAASISTNSTRFQLVAVVSNAGAPVNSAQVSFIAVGY